jgi:hypothetical protein
MISNYRKVRSPFSTERGTPPAKIADLRRMERALKTTVARCAEGRRSDCPVIEALYRNGSAVA